MRGSNAAELAGDIEERVSIGALQPGDRLPPVRSLAAELQLAPNTVAAAYRRLGERGIVVGRGRSGTFVAPRPPIAAPVEASVPEGMLDLSKGNPDLRLLPDLVSAASTLSGPAALYGDRPIDERLVAVGSKWLESDGIPSDHMAVVSGALDGIERVLGAHVRPGDRVAVEDPGYSSVIDLAAALGLILAPVAVDDAGPIPDQLAVALDRGVTAFILTPRAQNPFGSALSVERATQVRTVLDRYPDVLVIEDDHASNVSGAAVHPIGPGRERWSTVRSVAKTYGPDLRLALLAGDATTVRRVEGRQRLGPGWVSHLLQQVAANLIGDAGASRLSATATETYTRRRLTITQALRAAGIRAHGASGLNVWVPVDDETAAVTGLRDRGIAVRPGARFRIRTGPGIRVTIASLDAPEAASVATTLIDVLQPGSAPARTG